VAEAGSANMKQAREKEEAFGATRPAASTVYRRSVLGCPSRSAKSQPKTRQVTIQPMP